MSMQLGVQPLLLAPGEGETTTDRPAKTLRIVCELEQVIITWFRYAPGEEGPEPHVHHTHSDAFYVLEGEVDFGLGPEVTRISGAPGTFVAAPPNVVHTFRNSIDDQETFLNMHTPSAGFGDLLRGKSEHFDQFDPPEDRGRALSDGVAALPGEGEQVVRETTSHLIKGVLPDLSVFEMTFAPEFEGVDPHTHDDLVVSFLVLEGQADFVVGEEVRRAGPGWFLAAPPGTRHGFSNPGPEPLRVLNIHAPDAGFANRLKS